MSGDGSRVREACRCAAGVLVWVCLAAGAARAQEAQTWRLYDFSETRLIEYRVVVTDQAETRDGECVLEFERDGRNLVLAFDGELGGSRAEFQVEAPPDALYQKVLVNFMMTTPSAPLAASIFAPFWQMFLEGQDLSVGSEWTFAGDDAIAFHVDAACSSLGRQGRHVVWREAGEVRAQACVDPELPLPLSVTYTSAEGVSYDLRMTRYEERQ